ncbi:protein OSCP1 [Phlebotomus argentipes]|uniref:protein OSCP1 n=1 Tax=Phlebotomus argentipes TaxID=94469 RepID=UPI0028935DDC|nr:protein OSCP1 [Phlebotomus argentipes]
MSRANVLLVINLGCEMLYVIDQRLKAQSVNLDKSAQVLRDLTGVLLDPKFLTQLISSTEGPENLLTSQQCRLLMWDIASCSLMRLDTNSYDKLWDLMVMLLKWQLHIAAYQPEKLLDITLRHLDGIGRLMTEMRKSILIDCAKKTVIDHWDTLECPERLALMRSLVKWLRPFRVKISILLRLGLQQNDGRFTEVGEDDPRQFYTMTIGENIYAKSANVGRSRTAGQQTSLSALQVDSHDLSTLADQLTVVSDEGMHQSTYCLLDNIILSDGSEEEPSRDPEAPQKSHEFVRITSEDTIATRLQNLGFPPAQSRAEASEECELTPHEQLLQLLDTETPDN